MAFVYIYETQQQQQRRGREGAEIERIRNELPVFACPRVINYSHPVPFSITLSLDYVLVNSWPPRSRSQLQCMYALCPVIIREYLAC